jgi:dienelactone hydrolase
MFLVLLNAGVIHRVGPNRLSVKLAREFAELGLSTLRFDLSGLGDSPPRTDTTSIDGAIALDTREAFEFLSEDYGAKRFVTMGLCSGGREAFRAVYRDSRVVGAVLVDPYAYPTRRFYLNRFGPRLVRASSWRNAMSGRNQYFQAFRARFRSRLRQPAPDLEICGLPEYPTRSHLGAALDRILARDAELLFVYTGGMPDYYNYRDQLRDAFPKQFANPKLEYEYIPEADHTFSSEDTRRELRRCLFSWLSGVGFTGAGSANALDSSFGPSGTANGYGCPTPLSPPTDGETQPRPLE